jgi:hypothetical protein
MAVLGAKLHPTNHGCFAYHWLACSLDHCSLAPAECAANRKKMVTISRRRSIRIMVFPCLAKNFCVRAIVDEPLGSRKRATPRRTPLKPMSVDGVPTP